MKLEIKSLTKKYGGNTALHQFTYQFTSGIYGLLGPNGAGKSTLMNLISDNLIPTEGEILADGIHIAELGKEYRRKLGYMPQQQGVYANFTLERFLWYMAALKGLNKNQTKGEIDKVIKLVNLWEVKDKKLGSFSGGMRQRALLAQAILGDPELIILDEPTAGLDPKERIRIRNLIATIAQDKIIIIATHVVADIEYISKEVLFLKKGILLESGVPHKLTKTIDQKVYEFQVKQEQLEELEKNVKISSISRDENYIYVRAIAAEADICYPGHAVKPSLEDLYLYFYTDEADNL